MVFQSRKTLAPEQSCAMVAAINFLSVCEVEAGDRWEFFCGSYLAGEEGGAESDSNIEHLYSIVVSIAVFAWSA